MNLRYSLGLLLALTSSMMHADRITRSTTLMINSGVSLNQQISSSSLSSANTETEAQFKISKSGRYFLSTDLYAAPGRSNIPVIYIASSDVVLDLGGKSLTLSSSNNMPSIAGIQLKSGVKNIIIMNGTINGTAANSRMTTGIIGTNNTNVLLDNVQTVSCSSTGISFTSTYDLDLNEVNVYGSNTGLSLTYCKDGSILDSSFCGANSCGSTNITGILASNCNNFELHDVSISNNTALNGTAIGLSATSCYNFSLDSVTALNNASTNGSTYGIYLNGCAGFVCNKAKAQRNVSGSVATICAGIFLTGSTGNSFTNCTANNNTTTGATCPTYGFRISAGSDGNVFCKCDASGNAGGATSGTGAGFANDASNYNTIQESTATNNSSAGALGKAYGILSSTASLGTTIRNSKTIGNNSTAGSAYGIAFDGEIGGSIVGCDANANKGGTTAVGIGMLATTSACINNTVEYNKMYANTGNNGANQYGFRDFAADCTTFLRGNVAFGHGKVFTGGTSLLDSSSTKMNYSLTYTELGDQMNAQMLIKEGDIANMNAFEVGSSTWFNFSILSNSISG
jgi:hypothetical protein